MRVHLVMRKEKGALVSYCGRVFLKIPTKEGEVCKTCARVIKDKREALRSPISAKPSAPLCVVREKRPGVPRCTYVNNRTGHQCNNAAAAGSSYCRVDHGRKGRD